MFASSLAWRFLLCIALLFCARAWPKVPVSVLGTYIEGEDSAYCDNLAKDFAQSLADDTSFLVFDLRKKNGPALDSAHEKKAMSQESLLRPMREGEVKWGLVVECTQRKEDYLCKLEKVELATAKSQSIETLHFLLDAGTKRKKLGQALVRPVELHFFPKRTEPPAMGALHLRVPANPAMLIRGMQILRRGSISDVPLGATLVIGDVPQLLVISMDNIHYVLYPGSSYTYMLPKVVQLNEGTLGIIKGIDSTTLQGKLKSATALDSSNLIWRSLAKVAALDSSNLIWKGLGRVTSLDSHNLILSSLGKVVKLDSNNLLLKTLGHVTSLDSTNLLLHTLAQVAALDSNNLVWKGLGQVSSLDSNNLIWKKLGQIASFDSNSIWKKLGLLAFQDSTIILTPSFIARGLPDAVLVHHTGSVSTMEVVKGGMSALPLLSSQEPIPVGALRVVSTRGYSLKEERLNPTRGDRIMRDFESVDPSRSSRALTDFLPGKLFAEGSSLRTADRPAQAFIVSEFHELDIEMDVLSSEKEGWSDFPGTFHTGGQEAGCYLCSPNRIGP